MWFQASYAKYIMLLLMSSGLLILLVDSKYYRSAGRHRERKAASLLGWTNIALGAGTFAAYWILGAFRA